MEIISAAASSTDPATSATPSPIPDELLAEARRKLIRMELDEQRPSELSIARLDAYQSEDRVIKSAIMKVAREIAAFRGNPLASDARFESFERCDGGECADGHWSEDVRLIKVWWSKSARYESIWGQVFFPESYLDEDWKPRETEILAKAQEEKIEEEAQNLLARENWERMQLAALKEKYP